MSKHKILELNRLEAKAKTSLHRYTVPQEPWLLACTMYAKDTIISILINFSLKTINYSTPTRMFLFKYSFYMN